MLPDSLNLDVEMTVQRERRKLGIYAVPVYVAKVHATGRFDLARPMARLTAADETVRLHLERAHGSDR